MPAPTESIRTALLVSIIASAALAAAPASAAHEDVPRPAPQQLDPTRLSFETVAGEHGNIYNVLQDRDGFLWLAGVNGVLKYDGYQAETISSGETASALFEDSEGLIWGIVRSGVVSYDKATGKITSYLPNRGDPKALSGESYVPFQKTQLITEDKAGHIWIATSNGLDRFDKKSGVFTAYKRKPGDATTLLDDDVWSVLTAKDGSLWVGTATGLQRFDPEAGKVLERYPSDASVPNAIHGRYVQATLEDRNGSIWAGTTEGGVTRLDPRTKTFSHYTSDTHGPRQIAGNLIYSLAQFDSSPELVWIATNDGLSIVNERDDTVTSYTYDVKRAASGGLGGKIVHRVIQDRSGILWLVVGEHGVLQKVDPGARRFQSVLRSQDPREGLLDVSCPLRLGPDGDIWVTEVTTGIARVDPRTGRVIAHLRHDDLEPAGFPAHIEDFDFDPRRKDVIWVVAKGSVVEFDWRTGTTVARYPSGTRSKVWPVWTDKRDPDLLYGTVWGEGLLRFDKRTGKATILTPDPARPKDTLSSTTPFPLLTAYTQTNRNQIWLIHSGVGFDLLDLDTGEVVRKHLFNRTDFTNLEFESHAAYVDSQGRFWMGHNRYDPANGTFLPFQRLFGSKYPSTSPDLLTQDRRGFLWLAGYVDGTITRLDPDTGATRVFTERDGIAPGMACGGAPVTLPDGQIWMAGTGGITFFRPDQIVDNAYRPQVHITKLTRGGVPIPLAAAPERAKVLAMKWNENFFEFEMAALSYRHPEMNLYKYKLEGVDKDWYLAGTKRSGRYTGLPAGTYTLRVRASNNDGVWSDQEASLIVRVTPPWWGTWWFRGGTAAALLALAFSGVRLRIRRAERRSLELGGQVDERTRELRVAKEAADGARQSAEAANRAKSVFLSNMSHELRTPLNSVLGFSRLMRNDRSANAEQQQYLGIINRSGEYLLGLINNVLDMSKVETGHVALEESPTDLRQLVEDVSSLTSVRAREKGLDFTVELSDGLPRHMMVDGHKLRQVLLNLLGNAVKYTPRGRVTMTVEGCALPTDDRKKATPPRDASACGVRFSVIDTGPGIRVEDRERIFLPFVQLEDRPSKEAGTGLGLAISRQFVALMGGEIRVGGEPGQGALFTVELPVIALSPAAMPPESRRGRAVGLAAGETRHRLLIAEDQPENRLLLRKMLEPFGFELREAVDGQEAVAIAEEWHPHLVWMDIRMPVMDGLEATRRIKATDSGAGVKIVATTAHALEEERREIMAAGCDDFVRKPYTEFEIVDALTRDLGVRFTYAEGSAPEGAAVPLSATALSGLPAELRHPLEDAVTRIDIGAVSDAIEKIRARDPALAEALSALATDLQFGQILQWISAGHDGERERGRGE